MRAAPGVRDVDNRICGDLSLDVEVVLINVRRTHVRIDGINSAPSEWKESRCSKVEALGWWSRWEWIPLTRRYERLPQRCGKVLYIDERLPQEVEVQEGAGTVYAEEPRPYRRIRREQGEIPVIGPLGRGFIEAIGQITGTADR